MVKIQLFLLKGRIASGELLTDVEHFKKIPMEKTAGFIKWLIRYRVNSEAYTEVQWEKFRDEFGFRSVEELNGAQRFATRLLYEGPEIDESGLASDLSTLGFEQERITLIIEQFKSAWDELEDFLKRIRPEAIPSLSSIRWRIDVRYGSGNYLKKPEVVALIRIGAHDGTHMSQIYTELDKDDLSWLETEIGKIKRAFLKAEEKLNQGV